MNELTPSRLNRQDLEVVIRRAAELEAAYGSDALDLTEDDVVRIGGEVGLSESNVRQALAEHLADANTEALLRERGWASRLCGPALVSSSRLVPRSADDTLTLLEDHFRANESLRLVRRLKTGSLWEPESGVLASLVRSMDIKGRGYQLAKNSSAVEVRVVPLGEEECRVTLVADLGSERSGWFWGLGFAAGVSTAGGVGTTLVLAAGLPIVAAVAAPAVLAASVVLARAGYSRSMEKMRLILDGLLDRLEHGETLEAPRPSWRDLF
jgi:hypothetical protein